MNRRVYNGLYRYNLSGKLNVPIERYKKPYFPRQELEFFAEKAKRTTFTCGPYTCEFARARKNNLVYLMYRTILARAINILIHLYEHCKYFTKINFTFFTKICLSVHNVAKYRVC